MSTSADAERLKVQLSTLLSQAHERSIALRLAPSAPSLTRPIKKSLPVVLKGLDELRGHEEEEEEELRKSWEKIRNVLMEDEEGRDLVEEAQRPYASRSQPLLGASSSSAAETSNATAAYTSNTKAFSDEPYRDDPRASSGPAPDSRDSSALYTAQQAQMQAQDGQLDALALSIARQREMGLRMGDELELHGQLLNELDGATDGTQERLDRARGRMGRLEKSFKEHASSYTIVFLIIALVIFILFVK
ncbi:SNARE protein TLG1/Syntaxin 6 [Ceraceosorus bombacis]|uniref:SNARE protein TLG1/Syntaxin 6 n=1 Tax=Ceraceosorus bombacis TaxID=401625 RepID=A0A0P1BMG8_9BASI|nr:SNARE protein TLG1/Syntaxin 6 [Ceraceosorus bombacis]